MKFSIIIVWSLLLMIASQASETPAWARKPSVIPVDKCGAVLNEQGEYTLTNDLCGAGWCSITIAASGIHLDTAGHTVCSIGAPVIVADGVSNVRIDGGGQLFGGNGLIIGRDQAVYINNLSVEADDDLGGDGAAVEIVDAINVTVTNSQLRGQFGISASVTGGVFTNNTVSGTKIANQGIVLYNPAPSSQPIIATARVLRGRRFNNVVSHNTITLSGVSSGNIAIFVAADRNLVQRNTISNAGLGVVLSGDSNRVIGNKLDGSSAPPLAPEIKGVYAAAGAAQNLIEDNTSTGYECDLFEANGPPCINRWVNNRHQTACGAVACFQ